MLSVKMPVPRLIIDQLSELVGGQWQDRHWNEQQQAPLRILRQGQQTWVLVSPRYTPYLFRTAEENFRYDTSFLQWLAKWTDGACFACRKVALQCQKRIGVRIAVSLPLLATMLPARAVPGNDLTLLVRAIGQLQQPADAAGLAEENASPVAPLQRQARRKEDPAPA